MCKYSFISLVVRCLISISSIILFIPLDQYIHLSCGFSLYHHEILPFNTRLRGDHDVYRHYYFSSRHGFSGYSLTLDLYETGDSLNPVGFVRQDFVRCNEKNPCYHAYINSYGYNDSDLIIEAITENHDTLYVKPQKVNKEYRSTIVSPLNINWKEYRRIFLWSNFSALMLWVWLFSLVFIPFISFATFLSFFDNRQIDKSDHGLTIILSHVHYFFLSGVFYFVVYVILFQVIGFLPFNVSNLFVAILMVVYWIFALALCVLGHRHIYKWYDRDSLSQILCPQCGEDITLQRLGEDAEHLVFHHKDIIWARFFRPRLYLHCPHCGVEEIVCPYCNKPISEEDKKCPHCGKRVL